MHVGRGDIKAGGPERPSPLSLDTVTFIPLPTSSLPVDLGLLSCQKRKLMENSLLFPAASWEEGERARINSHKLGHGKFRLYFPIATQGKAFSLGGSNTGLRCREVVGSAALEIHKFQNNSLAML